LEAPMASSDFGACFHDTCTWVPQFSKRQIFERGDLAYSVRMRSNEDGGTFVLRRDDKILLTTPLKDLSASVSTVWSSKSDWLAVTWSDGGAVGGFHTRVFHLVGDEVRETSATVIAFRDFRSRHSCKARGENVQAYRWDEATEGLVLVMSVYPASDCGKQMGHMEAYLVRPTDGSILQHFDLAQFNAYAKRYPIQ
jgi:hypothetical protein